MTEPGSPDAASAQPGVPAGPWAPPQPGTGPGQPHSGAAFGYPGPPAAPPARKTGAKKWIRAGGSLLVAAVIGIGSSTGWFGMNDPKVGDCVHTKGQTDFEVVDCGSSDAQYKVVGIDKKERTYAEMTSDPTACEAFQSWEVALFIGSETEKSKIYCAEPV
ncbi:MAG: LppU/SCO3897 family protein [Blastococcus sp.]